MLAVKLVRKVPLVKLEHQEQQEWEEQPVPLVLKATLDRWVQVEVQERLVQLDQRVPQDPQDKLGLQDQLGAQVPLELRVLLEALVLRDKQVPLGTLDLLDKLDLLVH